MMRKGGLCPLRLLSVMTELSIFMPFHSGGCTWEQLARGLFLEGLRTKLYEK